MQLIHKKTRTTFEYKVYSREWVPFFCSLNEIPFSKQLSPAFIHTASGECQRFQSSHIQCQPITVQEQAQYSQSLCSAKVRDKSVKDIIGTIFVGKINRVFQIIWAILGFVWSVFIDQILSDLLKTG